MNKKTKKKKRAEKLLKLENKWSNCVKCDLCENRTNIVFWRGHPCAKIMLLGEAPGKMEDEIGIPFIGDSGKILDEIIIGLGLNLKKDVFITNIVCCRPINNINPQPDQALKCRPRLERMINIVKPSVILLLGGTAAKHMVGITKITQWRGKATVIKLDNDIWYSAIPTFHPSYYLQRGRKEWIREAIKDDIQQAIDLVFK